MNAREVERITAYIERRKWDMKQTGTGLRYMIYEEGKGDLVKTRQHVSLNFSVELLNGINLGEIAENHKKTWK